MVQALIDSGADGNFIDREMARQLGLDCEPVSPPVVVRGLSGQRIAHIEQQTAPLKLLAGNHHETIRLHVIDCPLSPLVLGYPWLQLHNPHINWVTGEITSWGSHCFQRCLGSAATPDSADSPTSVAPPDMSTVPQEYHDLAPVFSKQDALSLPPHRPYDLAIDLLPGAPLPSGRLYNLSRPETEAMESYVRDSLAAGLVRPLPHWGRDFSL